MNKLINKRNGIIAGVVVICIIAAIVASTSFSSAMNLDEAKEIAKAYVPEGAEFIESEEEDRYFEVAFYDKENKEGFEVEVNKETGEVKKIESQLSDDRGAKEVKLDEEQVKQVVQNRFPGITTMSVQLTKDDGLYEYEVDFKADGFYGDADVHAESGAILESVLKYGTTVTIPTEENKENGLLSAEEAKDLAIKTAGGGTVRDIDLEEENQAYFYEVELHIDGMEKNYLINAETGEILLESEHPCYFEEYHDDEDDDSAYETVDNPVEIVENSVETVDNSDKEQDSSLISAEEAKEIVRTKIPGAEFVEFELEKDDGKYEYEGEAHLDGYEYEFEINASTGIITDWEKEAIEWDD